MKKVLIAAGGTGGHIFPALTVANQLKQAGVDIHWIGANGALEQRLIAENFPLTCLKMKGLRGKGLFSKLKMPFVLLRALWTTLSALLRFRPQVALLMGGYVCGPVGVMCRTLRIPFVIHEQNSAAGLTNRILAKYAAGVLCAFPHAFPPQVKHIVVGNPLRQSIIANREAVRQPSNLQGRLRILVLGGSQGAHFINAEVQRLLQSGVLDEQVEVWHQCGQSDYEQLHAAYQTLTNKPRLQAFIDDMPGAYLWADLVIARSGALTVSEIAASARASILIPYPNSVDNHQYRNAYYLSELDACLIMEQANFDRQQFADAIVSFINDRERLHAMGKSAQQGASYQATQQVISELERVYEYSK